MKKSELKAIINECIQELNESSSISVGDEVKMGFGSKGGAGFLGVVTSINGKNITITTPEGKGYQGLMKFATLETPKARVPNNKYKVGN